MRQSIVLSLTAKILDFFFSLSLDFIFYVNFMAYRANTRVASYEKNHVLFQSIAEMGFFNQHGVPAMSGHLRRTVRYPSQDRVAPTT